MAVQASNGEHELASGESLRKDEYRIDGEIVKTRDEGEKYCGPTEIHIFDDMVMMCQAGGTDECEGGASDIEPRFSHAQAIQLRDILIEAFPIRPSQ